jgi:hypothetical protein
MPHRPVCRPRHGVCVISASVGDGQRQMPSFSPGLVTPSSHRHLGNGHHADGWHQRQASPPTPLLKPRPLASPVPRVAGVSRARRRPVKGERERASNVDDRSYGERSPDLACGAARGAGPLAHVGGTRLLRKDCPDAQDRSRSHGGYVGRARAPVGRRAVAPFHPRPVQRCSVRMIVDLYGRWPPSDRGAVDSPRRGLPALSAGDKG